MAVYAGSWSYKGYDILRMYDPNRVRITIWIGPIHIKTLHDKDERRILKRAFEWIDKNNKIVKG